MNAQRECDDRREAIAACVMGELDDRAAEELREHLAACPGCRAFHEALRNEESAIRTAFDGLVPEPSAVDALVHSAVAVPAGRTPTKRERTIKMIKRYGKVGLAIAAAAAIILGVYTFFGPPDGEPSRSAAFADVAEHVQKAQTLTFKLTINIEGRPPVQMECMMRGRYRMRQVFGDEAINIIDFEKGRILTLMPKEKKVLRTTLSKLPGGSNAFKHMMSFEELQKAFKAPAEELGEKEIDGQRVKGYRVVWRGGPTTIWADAETGLLVRMVMEGQGNSSLVISDFVFDRELDESLFSMEVPAGYDPVEIEMDLSNLAEKDVVECLRACAGLYKGAFPLSLGAPEAVRIAHEVERQYKDEEEVIKKTEVITRGFMFVAQLRAGSDPRYVGKGIKLGDAEQPVFWYRPKDSETYRVIYGDLRVEDVAGDDLPAAPKEEPTTQPAEAAS